MLEIDGQRVSHTQMEQRFKIPVKKVLGAPVFEINPEKKPKDVLNGGFKVPVGKRFQAKLYTKDADGMSCEVRYYKTVNDDRVGNNIVRRYSPRKVTFRGPYMLINDDDLALFMYLSRENRQSPLRDPGSNWYFEFVDKQSRADDILQTLLVEQQAMSRASSYVGKRLYTLAKGFNIDGVDTMEENEKRAALMLIAKKDPAKFLQDTDRNDILFNGMIRDSVDKNIFVLKERSGLQAWFWNKGAKAGKKITDVTSDRPIDSLYIAVHENIEDYYKDMLTMTDQIDAGAKASSFLEKQVIKFDDEVKSNDSEEYLEDTFDDDNENYNDDDGDKEEYEPDKVVTEPTVPSAPTPEKPVIPAAKNVAPPKKAQNKPKAAAKK